MGFGFSRVRSVSVWVFTTDPLRVLILRRPAARAAGWQPVTGRVEPSDASLADACVREIREETGLLAPREVIDLGREHEFLGYDGVSYQQRAFAARYDDAAPVSPSPEHEEARWVDADEASGLLRWDEDHATLELLRALK